MPKENVDYSTLVFRRTESPFYTFTFPKVIMGEREDPCTECTWLSEEGEIRYSDGMGGICAVCMESYYVAALAGKWPGIKVGVIL